MQMSWKWIPGMHDHEAGSSMGRRRVALVIETPPGAASHMRERTYVPITQFRHYWEQAIHVPWLDVHLPNGRHLNPERVTVPVVLASGHARAEEIRRRQDLLPTKFVHDRPFTKDSPTKTCGSTTSTTSPAATCAPAPPLVR
ncbi:unnamed protein product [Triticum turgidum subsp. durum]|uniref:Uncharacterized protein n=1 Tax=Triticum turgidum subsp. durum TaxID=4567 RepID=A0A9R1QV48_TRITD|nr:unnamed protein product [Triticum turgidum subsp. durum]